MAGTLCRCSLNLATLQSTAGIELDFSYILPRHRTGHSPSADSCHKPQSYAMGERADRVVVSISDGSVRLPHVVSARQNSRNH